MSAERAGRAQRRAVSGDVAAALARQTTGTVRGLREYPYLGAGRGGRRHKQETKALWGPRRRLCVCGRRRPGRCTARRTSRRSAQRLDARPGRAACRAEPGAILCSGGARRGASCLLAMGGGAHAGTRGFTVPVAAAPRTSDTEPGRLGRLCANRDAYAHKRHYGC